MNNDILRFHHLYDTVINDDLDYDFQLQEFLNVSRKISKVADSNSTIYFPNLVISDALFIEAFTDILDKATIVSLVKKWKSDFSQYGLIPDLFPKRILELQKGIPKDIQPTNTVSFEAEKQKYKNLKNFVVLALSSDFSKKPRKHQERIFKDIIEYDIYGIYAETLDELFEKYPKMFLEVVINADPLINFVNVAPNIIKPVLKHLFTNKNSIIQPIQFIIDFELQPELLHFVLINRYYDDESVSIFRDSIKYKNFSLTVTGYLYYKIFTSFFEKSEKLDDLTSEIVPLTRPSFLPGITQQPPRITKLDISGCERFSSPQTCYYTDKLVRLALGEGTGLEISDLILSAFFLLNRKVNTTKYSAAQLCHVVKTSIITETWINKQLEYQRNLSNIDKEILHWYSHYGDELINDYLRKGSVDKILSIPNIRKHKLLFGIAEEDRIAKVKELIGRLFEIIFNCPALDKQVTVFRGFDGDLETNNFIDKGFSSASVSFKVAHGFSRGSSFMSIELPVGFRCILMSRYSYFPYEMEILLPPNTIFNVINKDDFFVASGDCVLPENNITFLRVYDILVQNEYTPFFNQRKRERNLIFEEELEDDEEEKQFTQTKRFRV